MLELGVSLYPEQETKEEIESYLKLASQNGFTKVFTSLFSIDGTNEEIFNFFKELTYKILIVRDNHFQHTVCLHPVCIKRAIPLQLPILSFMRDLQNLSMHIMNAECLTASRIYYTLIRP